MFGMKHESMTPTISITIEYLDDFIPMFAGLTHVIKIFCAIDLMLTVSPSPDPENPLPASSSSQ